MANLTRFVPAAPAMANFQRYGDTPVNHYTGIPDISFALGSIKLKNFEWPLSISYHAGGNKVQEFANPAGLGWVVNAGGFISCKVMGLMDVRDEQPEVKRSYYLAKRYDPYDGDCSNTQDIFFNWQDVDEADRHIAANDLYQPDLFYISTPVINSKFLIKDGAGYTSPRNDLSISLKKNDEMFSEYSLEFLVKDSKGNKFYFNRMAISSTSSMCNGTLIPGSENPGFALTKVITYEGEELNFTYSKDTYNNPEAPSATYKRLVDNQCSRCYVDAQPQNVICTNTSYVQEYRLSQIVSSNGQKVIFDYSTRADNTSSQKLNEIKFYNTTSGSDVLMNSWVLNQTYFGSSNDNNLRLKLDSISQKDSQGKVAETYKFGYNPLNLPERVSTRIDFGGYFNNYGYDISTGSNIMRTADLTYVQASILNKVTYPTGGHTSYEYALNSGNVSGLRIQSLRNYDVDDQLLSTKSFEYEKPLNDALAFETQEESYLFGNNPSNCAVNNDLPSSSLQLFTCYTISTQTSPIVDNVSRFFDTSIAYGLVTEYNGIDGAGGKTVYSYDDPEALNYHNRSDILGLIRGTLTAKNTYKKEGLNYGLVNSVKYYYEIPANNTSGFWEDATHPMEKRFWIKTLRLMHPDLSYSINDMQGRCYPREFGQSDFRLAILPLYLRKVENRTYEGGLEVLNTQFLDYKNDVILLPSHTYSTNSDGLTTHEYSFYAGSDNSSLNLSTPEIQAHQYYLSQNRVNETVFRKITKNDRDIFSDRIFYKLYNGIARFEKEIISPSGGIDYKQVEVLSYDGYGNPLNVRTDTVKQTSYLWSYNGKYAVAEIKNSDYAAVRNILGQTAIDAFLNSNPDKAAIDSFINPLRTGLPNTQISSVSYKPLIGVTSQTDAKGQTTYYEYDHFQRLLNIKDQQGNIVKSYEYHLKP
ncbi:hypothetical protein HQN84_05865 [Pedobacter steynii]|nr:hypothetical protein [Pedobacter steynii]NQX38362.1 hypothetical protein [Pedobacter steynii]